MIFSETFDDAFKWTSVRQHGDKEKNRDEVKKKQITKYRTNLACHGSKISGRLFSPHTPVMEIVVVNGAVVRERGRTAIHESCHSNRGDKRVACVRDLVMMHLNSIGVATVISVVVCVCVCVCVHLNK